MPSWLPGENVAFEQRDRALRQTVREECDGYRAHIAVEMQEDFPAHVEAHRELISVERFSAYRQARVQEELVRARHGEEQSAGECSRAGCCGARGCGGPLSVLGGSGTELVLADRGVQLREEQAMVSEFQDTALGMQARVDEFVEQYAESTKRVIDRGVL